MLSNKTGKYSGDTDTLALLASCISKSCIKTKNAFPSQSRTNRKNEVKFLFSHFFVMPQKVL